MDPKTWLECCKCAKAYNQERELDEGIHDAMGVSILRTLEHRNMILLEYDALADAAKGKNWGT